MEFGFHHEFYLSFFFNAPLLEISLFRNVRLCLHGCPLFIFVYYGYLFLSKFSICS